METSRDGGSGAENPPLLGALLRIPYQAMMADVVAPGLAAAGYGDVRPRHLPLTQTLARHPRGLRATELAARARITKQSMGTLIDELERGGYVERAPDPADGRARLIRLTSRGWEFVATIRRLAGQAEADFARLVGEERVEALRGLLTELVGALDRRADEPAGTPATRRGLTPSRTSHGLA